MAYVNLFVDVYECYSSLGMNCWWRRIWIISWLDKELGYNLEFFSNLENIVTGYYLLVWSYKTLIECNDSLKLNN